MEKRSLMILLFCLGGFAGLFRLRAEAPAGSAPEGGVRVFVQGAGGSSTQPATMGSDLLVWTLEASDGEWRIRAGLVNSSDSPLRKLTAFSAEDFRLISSRAGVSPLSASAVPDEVLRAGVDDPIPAGSWAGGTIRFPAPAADSGEWSLEVSGFPPVPLKTAQADQMSFAEPKEDVNLAEPVRFRGAAGILRLLEMEILSVRLSGESLIFTVRLSNFSRLLIQGTDRIYGGPSVLLTRERAVLRPSELTGGLVAPENGGTEKERWAPGETREGEIHFPRPSHFALTEMMFRLPGFPGVRLKPNRDPSAKTEFAASVEPVPEAAPDPQDQVIQAELEWHAIGRFWEGVGAKLAAGDVDTFAAHAVNGSPVREEMRGFALSARGAGVNGFGFKPAQGQRVTPGSDGAYRGMLVDFQYHIATIPKENEFLARVTADVIPDGAGGWRIGRFEFPEQQPFWQLGYTAALSTTHFLIFTRADLKPAFPVAKTGALLEDAWSRLVASNFPVDERSAVFLAGTQDDFRLLTGRSPSRFGGAATSVYGLKDGRFISSNRAVYLNDSNFQSSHGSLNSPSRADTIRHELAHLGLAAYTRPFTPAWLVEGIAMNWAGQDGGSLRSILRRDKWLQLMSLTALSRVRTLGSSPDQVETVAQYVYSAKAVTYLRQKFGPQKLLAFYRSFAAYSVRDVAELMERRGMKDILRPDRPMPLELITLHVTMEEVRKHFGLSLEQLDAAVKRFVLSGP